MFVYISNMRSLNPIYCELTHKTKDKQWIRQIQRIVSQGGQKKIIEA